MSSTTKPDAKVLAYRWGELQEEPSASTSIDDLMIDLTTAFIAAQATGEEERAECLDEVLEVLAEGIVKYEHPADQDLGAEMLAQAIAEIRTYYYLESGIPRAWAQETEASTNESGKPTGSSLDPDSVVLSRDLRSSRPVRGRRFV